MVREHYLKDNPHQIRDRYRHRYRNRSILFRCHIHPADVFYGSMVDVQSRMCEGHSFPFDPDSDADSDPDQNEYYQVQFSVSA